MNHKVKIPYENLQEVNKTYAKDLSQIASNVISKGWYILGYEVTSFEKEFANYIGTKFAIGVANGLDA